MAIVNVIAEMNGTEYPLAEESGVYSSEITAPSKSTDVDVIASDDEGNITTVTRQIIVGAEWLPPKTDWKPTDYLNAIDYNRIRGNIAYLKALADTLFLNLTDLTIGEKKERLQVLYAREMNGIEDSLDNLNNETYGLGIGDKQTFFPNRPTVLWSEINRIESACLLLYEMMTAHKNALPRLAFTLGRQKGIKV